MVFSTRALHDADRGLSLSIKNGIKQLEPSLNLPPE